MRFGFILSSRGVRSTHFAIQNRIRQTKGFFDQPFLGVNGGHLRNRIGLIQRKVTSREPGRQHRKIGKPSRHRNQLTCRKTTQPQSGRHPIHKTPNTIAHPRLANIGSLNQDTKFGGRSSMQSAELIETPVDLIRSGNRPIHNVEHTFDL
ncbi:MAG: hypothetical protein V3S32_08775 [Acidimicrobiia bacterium]